MRIKIAGGCGEHGRNCFYIEGVSCTFLVDCGLMAGEEGGGYPNLTEKEIQKIDYIFLTHSHADHTGAIPWAEEKGFDGVVVATKETLSQLPFQMKHQMPLDEFVVGEYPLKVRYGRSGHCVGSVWYQFECEEKTLFFSGDYVEENFVHEIDLIRGKIADLAIIDCAYGYDQTSFGKYVSLLIKKLRKMKTKELTFLLPVPKYGRGLELYYLLKKKFPKWTFSADSHFIKQFLEFQNSDWKKDGVKYSGDIFLYEDGIPADVVFVSDPQLRSAEARMIAEQVLNHGHGIMTGTVETGSMSEYLLKKGKMTMLRFPVHLNYSQFKNVAMNNMFHELIMYHSNEIDCNKEFIK